jgi:hypothetical protein
LDAIGARGNPDLAHKTSIGRGLERLCQQQSIEQSGHGSPLHLTLVPLAQKAEAVQGFASEQQFDLIAFLDGQERGKKAVESSLAEFRRSCQRRKWPVLVQQ